MTALQEKPRYFYRDPLAAAWAVKQLGIAVTRTHCRRGDGTLGESNHPVPTWVLARDSENKSSLPIRYYIQSESILLDSLTADQKAAMQLLGLWPESEAA